jgi:hypothetical protein
MTKGLVGGRPIRKWRSLLRNPNALEITTMLIALLVRSAMAYFFSADTIVATVQGQAMEVANAHSLLFTTLTAFTNLHDTTLGDMLRRRGHLQ